MVAKSVKKSVRVYQFLDANPDFTLPELQAHFKNYNKDTVKSYFYRWNKKIKAEKKGSQNASKPAKNANSNAAPDANTNPKKKTKLPEHAQKIFNFMQPFHQAGMKISLADTVKYFKETGTFKSAGVRDQPKYKRPSWNTKKQNAIIDAITAQKYKIYFIEGSQRTGKSTAIFEALHELVLKYDPIPLKIDLMAGKGGKSGSGGATRINQDLNSDPLMAEMNNDLVSYYISGKTVWYNSSKMICHETTVADIKGADGMVVWIDELDVAIRASPEAVLSAMFILLARTDITLILSANMDTGGYRLLKEELMNGAFAPDIWSIQLTDEDAPYIKKAGNLPLLANISDALVGKGFTERRLHNVDLGEGELFPQHLISQCMNSYDEFLEIVGSHVPAMTVIGVDGGFGHPCGIVVLGMFQQHIYEIESHELFGKDYSDEYIKKFVAELANDYSAMIVAEIQWGMKYWIRDWKSQGLMVRGVVFTGDKETQTRNTRSRGYHVRELKKLMELQRFHFCSDDLRRELTLYSLDKKVRPEEKGDTADATLHAIHRILRSHPDIIFIPAE